MVPVALHDRLRFQRREAGISMKCSDPSLPLGRENLVVRAAMAFFQRSRVDAGVDIFLEKWIPSGAGLGGGSSDAAATLVALNELFDAGLSTETLHELAAENGSDTAWFLNSRPAICRGRGEHIEPVSTPLRAPLLLIKPPFPVSTPKAYQAYASQPGRSGKAAYWRGLTIINDLEPPVFEKFLLLPALKNWLANRPDVEVAAMSGSGSTLFAIPREGEKSLSDDLREEFGETLWVCRTEIIAAGR